MSLEKKIYDDYVVAMKARDKAKIGFLSFVRGEMKNLAIDLKRKELEDSDVITVLKKQQKRLMEAKEMIVSSGRSEQLAELENEIKLLAGYLPEPLTKEELEKQIEQVISDLNATTMKDMGRVMKEVLSRAGARADNKIVSELVKSKLHG